MKILKEGKLPETPTPIYEGMEMVCSCCGCEFILEIRDPVIITQDRNINGWANFQVDCPYCNNWVVKRVSNKDLAKKRV